MKQYYCCQFFLLACVYICVFQTCAFSVLGKLGKNSNSHNEIDGSVTKIEKKSSLTKKCDPCPKNVHCVPPIQCPAYVRLETFDKPQLCDLPAGTHGYCCTSGYNHTKHKHHHHNNNHNHNHNDYKNHLQSRQHTDTHDHHHHHQLKKLNSIIEEGRAEMSHLLNSEKNVDNVVSKSQPTFMHSLVFRSTQNDVARDVDMSHRAMEQVLTSQVYKRREHISPEDFELMQVDAYLEGTPLEQHCNQPAMCPPNPSLYRSHNGQCNNYGATRNTWGAAGAPMERLLPPAYEDGIWEPKTLSVDGSVLTNARTISRVLFVDADRPHSFHNLLFMQFGQFLTHDVTQSASITTADGKPISCCTADGSSVIPTPFLHYACLPIVIEPEDHFFGQFNQGCINFVRSALSLDNECKLGYGKQLSKVTHFIDASTIYGSDIKTQSEVRSFRRGMLRMTDDFGRDLLPITNNRKTCGAERGPCFVAGDGRSNQIITLTVLHTLFAREHNRIADILGQLNHHWSDEKIFYETRAIVIAKLQHIVYSEWLPHLIGNEAMDRFNLNIRSHGYSSDYNENINPAITSEFSTAAFRFGHSIVDGKFTIHHGQKIDEIINIPDVMFNSARLRRRQFYDEIMNTLTQQPMQSVDAAVSYGLSRYLFRGDNPFGLDLAAINIQRGRDHGIRGYNDYLEVSGHTRVTEFIQFGPETAGKLASVYRHPDDIDLWVGGLLETATGGAVVGPTFTEIIADQFSRFRRGDRYFYEHNSEINPAFLSIEQLNEIRQTTIARLICDNADGDALRAQSPMAFIRPDVPGNAPVPCSDYIAIPRMNYRPWKEEKEYQVY